MGVYSERMGDKRKFINVLKFKIMKYKYKIRNADGTYLNNGTGLQSWFTIEEARKIVNYEIGQQIREHDGMFDLWEVL
jgi:hypothetical protein